MGKIFSWKPKRPPRLDGKEIRLELLHELEEIGEDMLEDFEQTIATWDGETPDFEVKAELTRADGATMQIVLVGDAKGINKWLWLNFGTSVRYAQLSEDWESKTVPGRLRTGQGAGRVVRIDVNNPQPGIEARGWSGIIAEDWRPKFRARMQEALRRGAQKATA